MLKTENFKHLSTYLIAKEAENRKIKVSRLITEGDDSDRSLLKLSHKGRDEYIVGQRISKTSVIAYWIQKNKYDAKLFFKKAGLSVAAGEVFLANNTKDILAYAEKIGYPVVAKKTNGTHGDDVYVNITDSKKLRVVLKNFAGKVMIENMFSGTEYRLFATKDRFVAATLRIPANVVGDGKSTIKKLVATKNKDPRRTESYRGSLIKIMLDSESQNTLNKQGFTVDSIPEVGQQVFLRENSNLSTGGDSIDVTDIIHDDIKDLAVRAIKAIPGLAYAGVDILLKKDIEKKPNRKDYIIIEVNDSPMISMHHQPYEGKERDAAGAIIDILFPETKK